MSTRLATYAKDLKSALEDRLVPVEGGPLDGQLIMSAGVMQEAIASVIHPPVDEYVAEVRTPATIYIDLLCHICGESSRSTINIESKTLVDDKRRTIAPKIDADTIAHMCGQMPLPVTPYTEGQEAFDWTIPVEDLGTGERTVSSLLLRVGVEVPEDAITGWTEAEREEAIRWAVAVHVARESDEAIPEAPEAVARDGHPTIEVGADPSEVTEDPTVCPYPDCEKLAEHRGNHGKPRRRAKAGDADNADGNESDLLPGEHEDGFYEAHEEGAP